MADTTQQLFELWRKQFEEGAQAWARLAGQSPTPPPDPTAFWRPLIEQWAQAWTRVFAQTPMTPDIMAQWKQLLDQSIEAWSRALGQAMQTEAFAQTLGRYLDQWLAAYGPAKKMADQSIDATLQGLNLASGTQLTALARQIVELDERVERLEDGVSAILKKVDALGVLLARLERPAPRERP